MRWLDKQSLCTIIQLDKLEFEKGGIYYDWMSRDFFKYLIDVADQDYWLTPGSNVRVYKEFEFKRKAEEAHSICENAISYYAKDYNYLWADEWRKIYGSKFPTA